MNGGSRRLISVHNKNDLNSNIIIIAFTDLYIFKTSRNITNKSVDITSTEVADITIAAINAVLFSPVFLGYWHNNSVTSVCIELSEGI